MILNQEKILELLKEINSEAEILRRQKERENQMIYEGQLHLFVENKLKTMYPITWEAYNVADYNVHKKITDKKSKSYIKPPARTLDKEPETPKYNEILEDGKFNDVMKLVDTYMNRHRYCGLGIIREKAEMQDGSFKDMFNFWALTPYEFTVHRDNNGNIYAWSLPTGKMGDLHVWTIWTSESHVKIATKDYKEFKNIEIADNPDNINPFGIIPFLFVPEDCAGAYPYHSSLPRQTIELNTNLSVYLTSGNMQIGQLVLKYPKTQKIEWIVSGLMTAMKLEQETKEGMPKTEADYISPTPNLEGHKESILTYMMMIRDEHGMNSNQVTKAGEKFTSGFDRLIANADVQDIIENNQDAFTRIENAVYNVIRSMKDGIYNFKSEKLSIKFARPKILTSDSEKLDNLAKKKALGLWEDWELILEADPNLTEDEAKAKANILKALNAPTIQAINGDNQNGSVEGN